MTTTAGDRAGEDQEARLRARVERVKAAVAELDHPDEVMPILAAADFRFQDIVDVFDWLDTARRERAADQGRIENLEQLVRDMAERHGEKLPLRYFLGILPSRPADPDGEGEG